MQYQEINYCSVLNFVIITLLKFHVHVLDQACFQSYLIAHNLCFECPIS